MEQFVTVHAVDKRDVYEEIIPQIAGLIGGESDVIANLANVSAALKLAFPSRISWVGFYLARNGELVLGPFQGKPACVRIKFGTGVCGKAAESRRTVIVPDVHQFSGHIFCDPDSRSEIVVPLLKGDRLLGVLDVDSTALDAFDEIDGHYLQRVVELIIPQFP